MVKIMRYPLTIKGEQFIDMPIESDILAVVVRHNALSLYVLVDTTEETVAPRRIVMLKTEDPFPMRDGLIHIESVFIEGSNVVLHIFEDV